MIRSNASETLYRGRGILIALGVILLGLWWAIWGYGLLVWLGYLVLTIGVALLWTGWQRLRFGAGQDGPGIVHVDEGRISYFGPLTGGQVARSNLTSLSLDPNARPAHWVLGHSGGEDLYIPVTAAGADALFDYFSGLPGMPLETLLRAANRATNSTGGDRALIWAAHRAQTSSQLPHQGRSH